MDYYSLIRPLLFQFPAETAHHMALAALKSGMLPSRSQFVHENLRTQVFGLDFPNPLGMAAGFDKDAECIKPLLKQGFGFVEVGTVTPKPQEGNPKPRLFRLAEDEAVINRMGFNNKGVEVYLQGLEKDFGAGIVGANIGKNKTTEHALDDYRLLLQRVYGKSDYITVNISSPNTPGLRDLQEKKALEGLLGGVAAERKALAEAQQGKYVPILVKIAPDVNDAQCEDIAEVVLDQGIDGIIVSNTTIARPDSLQSCYKGEVGGLSGRPLLAPSTAILRKIYNLTKGNVPLVGVGGVDSGAAAYQKIRAGASLVQLYSSLVYQGFEVVSRVNGELSALLEKDGVKTVSDAVGVDCK